MATQSISSNPVRQAVFAQEKLERIYQSTHKWLTPYREFIEFAQDVLIWKKPLASALLYIIIHWMFIMYVQSNATAVTALANGVFWCLVADGLWRAASKDGFKGVAGGGVESRVAGRNRERRLLPNLESALMQSHRPRGPSELPSFEVLCLWVSEAVMWLDNLWLALRHWSTNDPVIFTFTLAVPGLVFSLVGKYMPTTVFLYIQVIAILVMPYVEHHCLRQRTLSYISAQYPGVLRRAQAVWKFIKAITVNRDRSDDQELSLNLSGNDYQTQASLGAEFEQATATTKKSNTELELPEIPTNPRDERGSPRGIHRHVLTSNDSLTLDSFVGGPIGDFPSLTDIDSSLALPVFPSGDPLHSIMPTISEQNEVAPRTNELEFEFNDGPSQGRYVPAHSTHPQRREHHPLEATHMAPPASMQPRAPPLSTIGFDNLGFSMYTTTSASSGTVQSGFGTGENGGEISSGTGQSGFGTAEIGSGTGQSGFGTGEIGFGTGQSGFETGESGFGTGEIGFRTDLVNNYMPNYVAPPTYQQVEAGSPDAGFVLDWSSPNESSTPAPHDENVVKKRR